MRRWPQLPDDNLDLHLAEGIAAYLRIFRDETRAYPGDLARWEAWAIELDHMIQAFEAIANEEHLAGARPSDEHLEAIQTGIDRFAYRFMSLWF